MKWGNRRPSIEQLVKNLGTNWQTSKIPKSGDVLPYKRRRVSLRHFDNR